MTDTQSARMLIMSIPSFSETTIKLICATVWPLTRKGVSDYLRLYEQRHEWSSHAIREVNGVAAGQSQKKNTTTKCTETECIGPHPAGDCWSKPENFEKRDKYFARRKGQSSTASGSGQSPSSNIRGVKKVIRPTVHSVSSGDPLAFHTAFKDMGGSASAVHTGHDDWALHDTGATHHVFKDPKFFKNELFKENDVSSKRLKLARGDVSLNFKGQ